MPPASRAQQIDQLRRHISRLSPAAHPERRADCATRISGFLEGEAPPGLHEIRPHAYLDTPSAFAFQAGVLARWRRPEDDESEPPLILWARAEQEAALDFGRPCPQALKRWGLDPARILLVETHKAREALWAMEEGLRAGALVVGEIGTSLAYDLTASKRLSLAAREAGLPVFTLLAHQSSGSSAALTRWRIAAAPSPQAQWRGASGLPGLGAPCFSVALERMRGGAPRDFVLEWKNEAFHRFEPAALADSRPRPQAHAV